MEDQEVQKVVKMMDLVREAYVLHETLSEEGKKLFFSELDKFDQEVNKK